MKVMLAAGVAIGLALMLCMLFVQPCPLTITRIVGPGPCYETLASRVIMILATGVTYIPAPKE